MRTLLILAATLLASTPALGRWKAEYASQPQSVQDWYENAQVMAAARPRLGFQGCCKHSDVVKTEFRVDRKSGREDEWWYLSKITGKFEQVPPDIIHWGEHAPDGQATLFALSSRLGAWPVGTPSCFYPPDGGL